MTSVVFLEIPKPWRVWSGFRNNWITDGEVPNRLEFVGSKPTWSLVNPVDEEDYDETSAFPATKPDMDVFCPPLRSRSQRGWYQIKAFPFPRPFFDTYGSSYQPHITLRTGAELPAELLARILEIVVDNRTLKACALVNHYWAKLCQKRLWATTVLHKRDDAVRLLDFLRTEVSHIRHYIYHVDFHSVGLKPAGQPWFHLLSSIYETLGRDPRPVLEMKMEGPINKGSGCLRSIHHGLPRVPPHFSWPISRLCLSDITFIKLTDAMHLIWEMRSLRQLVCVRVDFGLLPTSLLRAAVCNKDRYIHRIEMSECRAGWAQAALWLAVRLRPKQFRFFTVEDLNSALTVAKAFEQGAVKTDCSLTISSVSLTLACKADPSLGVRHVTPQVYWRGDSDDRINNNAAAEHANVWRIVSVAITMPRCSSSGAQFDWTKVDWKMFSEGARTFRSLRTLILGFGSVEEVEQFVTTVLEGPTQPVFIKEKLRYAVWDPQSKNPLGSWLRVTPDDLENKHDSRTETLWKVFT